MGCKNLTWIQEVGFLKKIKEKGSKIILELDRSWPSVTSRHSNQRIGWISGLYSLYDQSMPAKNSDGVLGQKIKILFVITQGKLKAKWGTRLAGLVLYILVPTADFTIDLPEVAVK